VDNTAQIVAEVKSLPYYKNIKNRLKRKYLAAYARTGNVKAAAKVAGCDWRNHYWWLERDAEFKQALEKSKEIAGDILEGQIFDAAMNGDVVPIIDKGVITGEYNKKSDVLRIFMLKGLKPQYRDNFSINQFAGPVQLNVKLDTNAVDPLQLSGNQALLNQGNTDK